MPRRKPHPPAPFHIEKLSALYGLFNNGMTPPQADLLKPEDLPEPCRSMLAHDEHMTVTLERHCGGPLNVRVLAHRQKGAFYVRKSLLSCAASGRIVQFGIMKIDIGDTTFDVSNAILDGRIPLGRILIEHNIMRRVSVQALLRLTPNAEMARCFGLEDRRHVYGRLATIHWNEKPAVDLLEVLAPV